MSKWWKCDLQVASPGAPDFERPPHWDLTTEEGRDSAAAEYMQGVADSGVEVIALADHNSADWVDRLKAAGSRAGVVVFPGLEVTSGSGSDGIHLIIVGGLEATSAQLNELLVTACGFGPDSPRFLPGTDSPASSPRTVSQILDSLPASAPYLVIAPHAFGDNGIASKQTAQGDIRWKALHHDRLGAIDVGHVDFDLNKDDPRATFRERFVRRQLDQLPAVKALPFVSTSDAYSIAAIGSRYTWIRMEEPSIEALRQAFLDPKARVICDWDGRYAGTGLTPNSVAHGWVETLTLTGLTTTEEPLVVDFDPRLTVLIGGRGAGKSTIVASLRNLYGDSRGLPRQALEEATQLNNAVFSGAVLTASHALPFSGEEQSATWSQGTGSRTVRTNGTTTPTDFKVRVISQKELFERAAANPLSSSATSQNLLALVDDALAASGFSTPARFDRDKDDAISKWVNAARAADAEEVAIAEKPSVVERVDELRRQVAAFDDEASKTRRERNDHLLAESRWIAGQSDALRADVDDLQTKVASFAVQVRPPLDDGAELSGGAADLANRFDEIRARAAVQLAAAIRNAEVELEKVESVRRASDWAAQVAAADADTQQFIHELAEIGIDPDAYSDVRDKLADETRHLAALEAREMNIGGVLAARELAWAELSGFLELRRQHRVKLLDEVEARSGTLRFTVYPSSDLPAWTESVRELLGLRADGFIEDVPALGTWLWSGPLADSERRSQLWRAACVSGDMSSVAREASLRPAWVARLSNLDPLVRTRLGAEVADDTVSVEFLQAGVAGTETARWVPLTSGSPGQRSSAMLSFVLHHGVEPLVLDQPEDDLDTEWISQLVVEQLRASRWHRQLIVVTHNANIPVNADAERVVVLENLGDGIRIRSSSEDHRVRQHAGAIEDRYVREDIQKIMEGGVEAFVRRERRYNNETSSYRLALRGMDVGS